MNEKIIIIEYSAQKSLLNVCDSDLSHIDVW